MTEYEYDLAVIGGGSGGMAAAKEASKLGLKVVMFDFVKPTVHGTKWGLGGTCVNVGCIPKKLMHYAGLIGAAQHDARKFGWNNSETPELDWANMAENTQNYVKQLNFGYKMGLRGAKVKYINGLAAFSGKNEITYKIKEESKTVSFANAIIAVGGRPIVPDDIPGAQEFAITSDDLFWLKKSPGKSLVVGGSYIALECAGFMHEVGIDVTVAVRSIVLRGFDRQCSEKIASNMTELGVKFRWQNLPTSIVKTDEGKLKVTFKDGTEELFDTVMYAVGRNADTPLLGLETVGISTLKNGKIEVDDAEKTCIENIFAVGDVAEGRPELTPVAIQAGEYLARRIAGKTTKLMDYVNIATAVFTPYEYGCVGYSQEDAEEKFGKENLEVYLFEFSSLELSAAHREKVESLRTDEFDVDITPPCLSKLVCNKLDNERVVGWHFVGPNAGEICQGFALAVRLGATKSDFDDLVGIHPTDAESFCAMDITLASGEDFRASGGCGGGKCG